MEYERTCPKCGAQLPVFTEDEKHNFCPANSESGRIVEICMKCKMEKITARWREEQCGQAKRRAL